MPPVVSCPETICRAHRAKPSTSAIAQNALRNLQRNTLIALLQKEIEGPNWTPQFAVFVLCSAARGFNRLAPQMQFPRPAKGKKQHRYRVHQFVVLPGLRHND